MCWPPSRLQDVRFRQFRPRHPITHSLPAQLRFVHQTTRAPGVWGTAVRASMSGSSADFRWQAWHRQSCQSSQPSTARWFRPFRPQHPVTRRFPTPSSFTRQKARAPRVWGMAVRASMRESLTDLWWQDRHRRPSLSSLPSGTRWHRRCHHLRRVTQRSSPTRCFRRHCNRFI